MLVTGDREAADGTVSVRSRSAGDLGARPVHDFIAAALEDIRTRTQNAAAPEEQQPV